MNDYMTDTLREYLASMRATPTSHFGLELRAVEALERIATALENR